MVTSAGNPDVMSSPIASMLEDSTMVLCPNS